MVATRTKEGGDSVTRQAAAILFLVLAMIGASAAYLGRQQQRHRLGTPGVVVTNEPIFIHDGVSTNAPVLLNSNRVFLPADVLDYESEQGTVTPMVASVLPQDTVFGHRMYGNSNRMIDCQVILMGSDRSSIHKPEGCLQGTGFETISSEPATIRISTPHPYDLPVRRLKLRKHVSDEDGAVRVQSGVFIYWFVSDGDLTSEHAHRMWSMAKGLLTTGVLQRWAYVICYSPCEPGREDETFEDLERFIATVVPQFQRTTGRPAEGSRAEGR
jgi:hypothetical protein